MSRGLTLVALVLLAAGLAGFVRPAGQSVSIRGMKFSPASIEIKKGDSVTWTNDDDRDHTIVASDASFRSGNLSKGASFSHTFSKSGKFGYACSLHPRMKGSVVVTEK